MKFLRRIFCIFCYSAEYTFSPKYNNNDVTATYSLTKDGSTATEETDYKASGNEITFKQPGAYVVTASYEGKSATANVTVNAPVLTISPSTTTIYKDESVTFGLSMEHGQLGTVQYTVDKTSGYTQNESNNNIFTFTVAGTYNVTASTVYQEITCTATAVVTVNEPTLSIELGNNSLKVGDEIELRAKYGNTDVTSSTNFEVTSGTDNASITSDKKLKCVKDGDVTIKATYGSGDDAPTATMSINIREVISGYVFCISNNDGYSKTVNVGTEVEFTSYLDGVVIGTYDNKCTVKKVMLLLKNVVGTHTD